VKPANVELGRFDEKANSMHRSTAGVIHHQDMPWWTAWHRRFHLARRCSYRNHDSTISLYCLL